MIEREAASTVPTDSAPLEDHAPPTASSPPEARTRWQSRHELAWHRAETERVKVLVEFLARPIHAHGGSDPDPDIVTAYNLAVEAALQGIRRATVG
ncbi:hypothetical protein P12x_002662 [Tundrisphaera lichenicola]|uniref:hypothetical protein n=1 Tax=Tundrisphaera lichenicola TaxID=2029860 RepID=UPI003EB70860